MYTLRITYRDLEIYLFDDDVASAFPTTEKPPKRDQLQGILDQTLFVRFLMGLTCEDCSRPPSFESIARTRMALSSQPSTKHPDCPRLSRVYGPGYVFFTATTAGNTFVTARADRFNLGAATPLDGLQSRKAVFSMHVDDCLYTMVGKPWMHVLQCRWTAPWAGTNWTFGQNNLTEIVSPCHG